MVTAHTAQDAVEARLMRSDDVESGGKARSHGRNDMPSLEDRVSLIEERLKDQSALITDIRSPLTAASLALFTSKLSLRIDIWSDIVCPWCYIGKRRFERAWHAFEHRQEVEVVHRSFQLDPAMPKGTVRSHRDVLMSKYGLSESEAGAAQARMERTAADEGLEFRLVGGVTWNTFDAHRLLHLAKDHGIQDAVIERFYRAHFIEQRSIYDETSLVELATEAGLDADDSRDVLRGGRYAAAVAADLREARGLGVTGVPYYLLDHRIAVSGAQPTELFTEALTRAWAETAARANLSPEPGTGT